MRMTAVRTTMSDILTLLFVPGAGYVTVNTIITLFAHHPQPLHSLLGKPFSEVADALPPGCRPLAEKIAAADPSLQSRAQDTLAAAELHEIDVIAAGTPEYPETLIKALGRSTPPILFTRGNPALRTAPAAGIVGTRLPTTSGEALAKTCAQTFAEAGIPMVSGGAQGVDTAAQEAAWHAGGSVIVVLPQGLLTYSVSTAGRDAIQEGRALLVSEFLPYAAWQTHAAVTRNATISGFSRLVCVIEPGKTGGSLSTAKHALEQNKPVFFYQPNRAGQWLREHPETQPLRDSRGSFRSQALIDTWKLARPQEARQSELLL